MDADWPRRGRPPVLAVLALLLAAALVATLSSPVLAVFTASASVGSNSVSASSCLAAEAKTIQKGTATSTGNGTTTVAINAVDTTKAFLMFNLNSNLDRPPGSEVRGRVASATTLEFIRVTDETSTINIQWYLVEFTCGVKVQRGEASLAAGGPVEVPITPVGSVSQAFVTLSKNPGAGDQTWDASDAQVAELTSTSNLEIRTYGGVQTGHVVSWQVIEFTSSAFGRVQKGSTALTGGALSTTVTLPSAVDATKSFVLLASAVNGTGADIGDRLPWAQLTSSTTVTIDRSVAGDDNIDELAWQVVEFKGRVRVQQGNASFSSGAATVTAALSPVDTNAAIAIASTQDGGGQSAG